MAVVRRPFARARRCAREVLWECGFDSPEKIDPLFVLGRHRIQLIHCKLDGATAQILRHGDRAIIRLSDEIVQLGRIRFSIAHEVGHFILGHQMANETDAPIRSAHQEREADIFATELLMPESMFRPLVNQGLPTESHETVRLLASTFRASLVSTAVRYVEFSPAPCAVVYSERGVVVWAKRSKTFPRRIPERFAIGEGADAAQPHIEALDGTPRLVSACEWLGAPALAMPLSLVECTVVVPEPGWGGALSLLTCA